MTDPVRRDGEIVDRIYQRIKAELPGAWLGGRQKVLLEEAIKVEVEAETKALRAQVEGLEGEREGIRRFLSGQQVCVSMFIDEVTLTYGYGCLDKHGCWQYPVPAQLVKWQRDFAAAREVGK